MTKIAINQCHGGFSLSREAVLLARKLSNNPRWGGIVLKGEAYPDGTYSTIDFGAHHVNESLVPRTDPILIRVIEDLGKAANGRYAELAIAMLPEGTRYRIDEYDGYESLITSENLTQMA